MMPQSRADFASEASLSASIPVSLDANPFLTQKDMRSSGPGDVPMGTQIFSKGDSKRQVDHANWAGMDVTVKMNELIETNGIKDPTAGETLLKTFGDNARGRVKMLKVAKGEQSLTFEEDKKLKSVFDLTPLFEDQTWKRNRSAQEQALDANDAMNDPVDQWIMGFDADGARRIDKWNHDVNYVEAAPDGTMVDKKRADDAKRKQNAPEYGPDPKSQEERWFDAASTEHTSHQQMLASRYFRELCALVETARKDPSNPQANEVMWTNDPKVFPLPRSLRAEGREGLPPWEQGVMPFAPDQRNYFVPSPPAEDTYCLDVYIADSDRLLPPAKKGQQAYQGYGVQHGPFYRAICSTGVGTNATCIVETDLIDPNFHNGWHEWGRMEAYQMPPGYDLPYALEGNHHPGKALDRMSVSEQEEYGLTFYIVDERGIPVSKGFAPPHMYYSWKDLRDWKQHLGMVIRRCSKWMPVQMSPIMAAGAAAPQKGAVQQLGPLLWVQVRVYAGKPAHKPSAGFCDPCCASNEEQEAGDSAPALPPDPWDLRGGGKDPEDNQDVFGPTPGHPMKAVVELMIGDRVRSIKDPDKEWKVKPGVFGRVATRTAKGKVEFFEFLFEDGSRGSCEVIKWIECVTKEKAAAPGILPHPAEIPRAKPKTYEEMEHWCRLTEFGHTTAELGFAVVFDTTDPEKSNCGRVNKGELDNMYFVEALNAISCRPKLAKQLFYAWDVSKGIYILRIMCNGVWVRVEIDDYVPPRLTEQGEGVDIKPSCCYSENFPYVLWPSLVEKAYAKIHTVRPPYGNSGGWMALGGGGRIEEAMADLTGGVAGRFSTKDATYDRLFTYFYRLQRYCIWVARVHKSNCEKHGVVLDTGTASYVVNRAAPFQGETYVQILGAGTNCHLDGAGLSTFSVPLELQNAFPEKPGSGYFWVHMIDFAQYFDSVFECRLTNSPDVGLKDMPDFPLPMHLNIPVPPDSRSVGPNIFKEIVVANKGLLTPNNPPEFEIFVPGAACPCEISCVLQQITPRTDQMGNARSLEVPLLLKVYQQTGLGGNNYSSELVCKSNWLPIRDAMVCFSPKTGGRFLVTTGFPGEHSFVYTMVFRVYSTCDGVVVTAKTALEPHKIVAPEDDDPPRALKWTMVGCRAAHRSDDTAPEPYNPLTDGLRVTLTEEANPICCVM